MYKINKKSKLEDKKVRSSSSSCCYNKLISKEEMIKRLYLADGIFYEDGEIVEVIVKTKIKGKIEKKIY